MCKRLFGAGAALGLASVLAFIGAGCADKPDHAKDKGKTAVAKGHTAGDGHDHAKDTKHEGWWCDEHGIPEAECSMCSPKVAKDCKAKGDWCDQHDRAKSQCFLCDPKLKDKYAGQYRAKYGKEPPPTDGK